MPVTPCKTKQDFDKALEEAGDRLVVVDFFATWCGPCKAISPKVEEFSKTFGNVVFLKVDVDENDETAESCEVQAMPTFIFFKNKVQIAKIVGADEGKLKTAIENNK